MLFSRLFFGALVSAAGLTLLGGCAMTKTDAEMQAMAEKEAAMKEAQMQAGADASQAAMGQNAGLMQAGNSDLFPPNPQPGHCYARVLIPAQYETTTERVVKQEPGSKLDIVPAKYEWVEERVLVREASTKLEVTPPEYETVTEQVVVKPASKKIIEVPAEYNTVTEKVLDKPAQMVWKRSSGPVDGALQTRLDQSTGEVLCLVEEPATYKTISKRVLVSPPTTKEVEIPAEYGTVKRRVVKRPAQTREVQIPAEYKTIKMQKLVQPPQVRQVEIPGEYATVEKRKKITEEKLAWREVMCEVNMTPQVVSSLQSQLKQAGYYKGRIDGAFGKQTLVAANRFAKAKNLPAGSNYIALETVKALGL